MKIKANGDKLERLFFSGLGTLAAGWGVEAVDSRSQWIWGEIIIMMLSQNQMCLFAHRRYVCECVNHINNLDNDLEGWSEGRLVTTNHNSSSIHLSSTFQVPAVSQAVHQAGLEEAERIGNRIES